MTSTIDDRDVCHMCHMCDRFLKDAENEGREIILKEFVLLRIKMRRNPRRPSHTIFESCRKRRENNHEKVCPTQN
jgi:hypothetical protein